jgi:Leucine-rich repeat (LRR) protein
MHMKSESGGNKNNSAARASEAPGLPPFASESSPAGKVIGLAGIGILLAALGIALWDSRNVEHASVYTPIAELTFRDGELRNCVVTEALRHSWATSGEIRSLTCIDPGHPTIVSLDGLENLVNLSELNLSHNRVSETTPLKSLTRLRSVNLGYNAITVPHLEGSGLAMRSLNLDHNELADLNWIGRLPNLETLSIGHNRISTLDVLATLPSLIKLDVSSNPISQIDVLGRVRTLEYVNLAQTRVKRPGALLQLGQLYFVDLTETPLTCGQYHELVDVLGSDTVRTDMDCGF